MAQSLSLDRESGSPVITNIALIHNWRIERDERSTIGCPDHDYKRKESICLCSQLLTNLTPSHYKPQNPDKPNMALFMKSSFGAAKR